MSRRASKRVCMAPMAVTSAGDLLLNIAMTDGPTDPRQLVERALAQGSPVFVGVVAMAAEVSATKRWIDDATAELVGSLWSGAGRRRRARRTRSRE